MQVSHFSQSKLFRSNLLLALQWEKVDLWVLIHFLYQTSVGLATWKSLYMSVDIRRNRRPSSNFWHQIPVMHSSTLKEPEEYMGHILREKIPMQPLMLQQYHCINLYKLWSLGQCLYLGHDICFIVTEIILNKPLSPPTQSDKTNMQARKPTGRFLSFLTRVV